jgi:hypothetical protein
MLDVGILNNSFAMEIVYVRLKYFFIVRFTNMTICIIPSRGIRTNIPHLNLKPGFIKDVYSEV